MGKHVLFMTMVTIAAMSVPDAVQSGELPSTAITEAVNDVVARYRLPGIAVGVVHAGDVRQLEVRGETVAGSGDKVDADTLFKIASNGKAMTAGVLARLVDAGRLRWDDPVTRHLPEFRMHDDWVTREIQVRDLLIHNSGLGAGAGDLMLWPSPNRFTRDEVIHGLRYLVPLHSFRSRYAYDNSLYIVAGEVAAAASGVPYDVLLRRELFDPLGMRRCQAGTWSRDGVGNVAQPHRRIGGRNTVIREDDAVIPDEPMLAAGGIRCSLDDMLAWTAMWLWPDTRGVGPDGAPWLSQAQRDAVWTAHTPMPVSARMRDWDNSHFSAYGYGWRLTDVDGTRKVSHTGTLAGMVSSVTLLPDLGVGIVVLLNTDDDAARTVLTQALVKQFTAPDRVAGIAHYAALVAADAPATTDMHRASTVARTLPSDTQVQDLAGIYRDPWFGEIALCPIDDVLRFVSVKSPKLDGDVWIADGAPLVQWRAVDVDVDAWLRPSPASGQATTLHMEKIDRNADFSYDFEDLAFVRIAMCPAR